MTSIENCNSIQDKTNIASDHFEANPTEGNRILSTNLSATNPQLAKEVLNFSECYITYQLSGYISMIEKGT